jgi:flagellar export protein FliJ
MAVSRALRRLLRIRNLEEEQNRRALELAVGELNRLESALTATEEKERRGRRWIESSVRAGDPMDRFAGLEEIRAASRHGKALAPRIESQQEDVADLRQEFLDKRVERRQAETMIEKNEAREAVENDRHGQQSLDDWYSSRRHRNAVLVEAPQSAARERIAAEAVATREDPPRAPRAAAEKLEKKSTR